MYRRPTGRRTLVTVVDPAGAFHCGGAGIRLVAHGACQHVLDVLSKDYIRTARAKGQRERWVIIRHALRNSLMAPLTIIGMQVGYLLGGAIIVEVIFFFPGMGRLLLEAGIDQDYSVVQGVALVTSAAFILVNVLIDFLYVIIDPRVRDRQ